MSTTYKCYPSINILNPDGSINCNEDGPGRDFFDLTLFDYIDLRQFGGEEFTPITTYNDIEAAFVALGLEVEIRECGIVLLNTMTATDIPSFKDGFFHLLLNNTILDPIDYNLFNIVDTSRYSETTIFVFVYSNLQLKNRLENIFNKTVDIVDNKIYVRKYTDTLYNIDVYANPTIQFISNGSPVTNNYTVIQAIDLSYYGGDALTLVTSDIDVRAAFLALGISVTISGSTITLLEYTQSVANINVCTYSYIEITGVPTYCNNNALDFNEIYALDFTPFGGSEKVITNNSSIITEFGLLGYLVSIQGCSIKVLNMACLDIIDTIAVRQLSIPIAVDDTIPDCIIPNIPYAFNPTANDIEPLMQMLMVTKINDIDVVEGSIVSLATGITVRVIANCNLELLATVDAVTTSYSFTYAVKNTDGSEDSGIVSYCVDNVINPGIDYLEFECNSSGSVDVSINDFGIGALTVTHINGMPVTIGEDMVIITNFLTARLLPDLVTVQLQSLNNYYGMGAIAYTITNGGTTTNSTINYNITDECTVCLAFDIPFTSNLCSAVSWGDLTYNGNPVSNYLLKLKKPNGDIYVLPSGLEFKIGKGIYSVDTFPPNFSIPIPSGTYSIYIEFSDFGDDIDCYTNYITIVPVPCGTICAPSYSGVGGISAQLSYDIAVSASSVIQISEIYTGSSVPDGIVIYYNGLPIYHTGNSVECPHTTPGNQNASFVSCIGCSYQSNTITPDAQITVPYVSGVNFATVVVFGYPCSSTITVWSFESKVICT